MAVLSEPMPELRTRSTVQVTAAAGVFQDHYPEHTM